MSTPSHTQQAILSPNAAEMLATLDEFALLENNWDSYGAIAPSLSALSAARAFIRALDRRAQEIFFVAPGPNGEISVELKQGQKSLEFLFFPDKLAKYLSFEGKNLVEQTTFEPNQLDGLVAWLNA